MGGALKHVERAENAVDQTVSHGTKVMDSVPSKKETAGFGGKEFSPSTNLASDIRVAEQGVNDLIVRAKQLGLVNLMSARLGNQPDSFDEAARGHEAPPVIFPSSGEIAGFPPEAIALLKALPGKVAAQGPTQSASNKDVDGNLGVGGQRISTEMVSGAVRESGRRAHVLSLSNEIASNWLTPSYLGGEVGGRFERTPPAPFIALELPKGSMALYLPEGNGIFLALPPKSTEADIREAIVHEQLHYAAYLGCGGTVRFIDEGGAKMFLGRIAWLDEGLTELHAQQLTQEHGFEPSRVAYPAETTVSFYIQQIAGEDALKTAYLTGDYTQVRQAIDAKLGAGTFDKLVSMERGADALAFLSGKLKENNIDVSSWNRNEIVARAGMV